MSSRGGAIRSPAAQRRFVLPRAAGLSLRWLAAHQHTSAALVFGAFVFLYLQPALIGGDILSPIANLYQFPPWVSQQPSDLTDYFNLMLGDVPMAHYPWNHIARDAIHDGVFPAWSTHAYAGTPFFANPQTMLLSPFSLPLWILPLDYGIGVSSALKLWVAAFGMYLLVRELRLGFWPGLLAGLSYALCAFSVLWLTHETLIAVSVILPWLVLLSERLVRTGSPPAALGLAAATALAISGGHPGTAIHVLFATFLFAAIRAGTLTDDAWQIRLRRVGLVCGGMALGALMIAVLIVPVWRAGIDTIGQAARLGGNSTIPGAEMGLDVLRTTLFPDWWGRPSAMALDGPANYNERTFYAGGVATIFAVIGLVSAGGWRRKAPFAVLGAIGLAVPLHVPVVHWLAVNLPLLSQVQPQRLILLYAFGAIVLAAFGLQRLLDAPAETLKRAAAVVGAAAVIGLLALGEGAVSASDIGQAFENIVRFQHAQGPLVAGTPENVGGRIATSVVQWLVVAAAVGAALLAFWRWPRRRSLVVAGLVAFAALELLYFAHDWQPMGPPDRLKLPTTPAVQYLQRHADEGRFAGVDGAMINNWSAAMYGLQDVRGYDPPAPSLRWFHLWQLVYPDQLDWSQAILPMPDARGRDVLSVLGTRYVAAAPRTDTPLPLPVVYRGGDAQIAINREAVPRTWVAPRVRLTGDEDETLATIGSGAFQPRREVVVEQGEPGAAELATTSGAGGRVRVADEQNSSVTLAADLRRRGLVVLNDHLTPGWSVEVDGEPADVVRVNSVMRGVAVDAGRHEIAWSYRVPGLRLGAALSLVAIALFAGAGAALLLRRRKAGAEG